MRHRKDKSLLNRFTSWRRATLISLARSTILHQRIKTTERKAKAAQTLVEKLISLGKDGSLAKKRAAYEILGSHKLVQMLFRDIAPRFVKRQGGYTRVIKLGQRRGDNAPLALLELTEIKQQAKKPKKEKEAKLQPQQEKKGQVAKEVPQEEKKPQVDSKVIEKPPITKKPPKKFFGGLRNIFKKERDSL